LHITASAKKRNPKVARNPSCPTRERPALSVRAELTEVARGLRGAAPAIAEAVLELRFGRGSARCRRMTALRLAALRAVSALPTAALTLSMSAAALPMSLPAAAALTRPARLEPLSAALLRSRS
jgi:hypothetical protein